LVSHIWFFRGVNILNVQDIERELRRYAARACHEPAHRWVLTVARNYFLGRLPDKDVDANFRIVSLTPKKDITAYIQMEPERLPPWALAAIERKEAVHWFDPIQPRRREFWNVLEVIMLWFNNWKPEDTRLRRLDRIAFPVATNAAVLWYKDVSENIWHYVTDKPVLVQQYEHGFFWVKMVSALQFEREGRLMNHCVGNGSYYNRWRMARENEYYSLRDKHNKPHATLEVSFDSSHPLVRKGSVCQCKGNSNRRPDKEYQPYIRRFIEDMKWKITGDGSHID